MFLISKLLSIDQEGKAKKFTGKSGFRGISISVQKWDGPWQPPVSLRIPHLWPGTWGPTPGSLDTEAGQYAHTQFSPLYLPQSAALLACMIRPALAHPAVFPGPAVLCSVH